MTEFDLHPRLETDSFYLRDFPLCQLRLNNVRAAPWFLLVPRRRDIKEIYELTKADRCQLIEEIAELSRAVHELYTPDKINVAALGNVVPQLHVHVIARFISDRAWPDPVFGKLDVEPYEANSVKTIRELFEARRWD